MRCQRIGFFPKRNSHDEVVRCVAKFLNLKPCGKDCLEFRGKKILVKTVVANEPIKAGDQFTFKLDLDGVVAVVFVTANEELGLFMVMGWLPTNLIGEEVRDSDLWSISLLKTIVKMGRKRSSLICNA